MIYLVAGNSNHRHGVPEDLYDSGYVEGIQILVDQEEVTVDEVLSAFSGPRKTNGAWERLMREGRVFINRVVKVRNRSVAVSNECRLLYLHAFVRCLWLYYTGNISNITSKCFVS